MCSYHRNHCCVSLYYSAKEERGKTTFDCFMDVNNMSWNLPWTFFTTLSVIGIIFTIIIITLTVHLILDVCEVRWCFVWFIYGKMRYEVKGNPIHLTVVLWFFDEMKESGVQLLRALVLELDGYAKIRQTSIWLCEINSIYWDIFRTFDTSCMCRSHMFSFYELSE